LVFAGIIHLRFIPREEKALERQFGDDYREYRSRVRTWL
jgi:protein-S-isoprenylcysteine O-methyltransferase Ste14